MKQAKPPFLQIAAEQASHPRVFVSIKPFTLDRHQQRAQIQPFWQQFWVRYGIAFAMLLGIFLRVCRYLQNWPLWGDEAMLAANFIDRDWWALLTPLDYAQVAPWGFLWVESAFTRLLGFQEYTLRLFPLGCAICSIGLLALVAKQLGDFRSVISTLLIVAVSGWLIRFSTEVKPYASDALLSTLALYATIAFLHTQRIRWLWLLCCVLPIGLCFSFPLVFVAGGVLMTLLPTIIMGQQHHRRSQALWVYIVLSVLCSLAFTGLWSKGFYKTSVVNESYLGDFWAQGFFPWNQPSQIPLWLLDTHTGYMMAYPEGAEHGGSTFTFLMVLFGILALGRQKRWLELAVLLMPFVLTMAASALHKYPYGLSARTMQHLAPAICLLAGLGVVSLGSFIKSPELRTRMLHGFWIVLILLGLGRFAWDLSHPYKFEYNQRARSMARWMWSEMGRGVVLGCAHRDFGVAFDPRHPIANHAATYFCEQMIARSQTQQLAPPQLKMVGAKRPLRVIVFNQITVLPGDLADWRKSMDQSFELVRIMPLTVGWTENPQSSFYQTYHVYDFIPREKSQ